MARYATMLAILVSLPAWLLTTRAEDRPPATQPNSAPPQIDSLIFTQIPVRSGSFPVDPDDAAGLVPGSRLVLFDPRSPAKGITSLTSEYVAAGRPDLSFDGRRILFVGRRRSTEPLGVWEMEINGRGSRPIVQLPTDCTEARYLSTLFTIDAKEPEHRICFCNVDAAGISSLYTCRMDGTKIRRITFNPAGASHPYPLRDGRLLFSSPIAADTDTHPTSRSEKGDRESRGSLLFIVNTDGTDVAAFAGVGGVPALRTMPCEALDGRVVFIEVAPKGEPVTALISVSLTRSLHSRQVLAASANGSYCSPAPLPDGRILVSYRAHESATYGIYAMRPSHGASLMSIYDSPDFHDVQALAVHARPEPAGRSSVVDDQVDFGYLYGLNANLSDATEGAGIAPGRIRRVGVDRFDQQVGGKSLGAAPVEDDGSFFLKVPARTALRLQTLDAEGNILQSMKSWVWVMPKEGRGCIGCHEDRELSPPNRHVLALRSPPHALGVMDDPHDASQTGHRSVKSEYPAHDAGKGERR